MSPSNSRMTAVRIKDDELEAITARAKLRGMSRSRYMIECALGIIDDDPADNTTRFQRIEERLARLEDAMFGG